jgi:hypothetical protein
VAAHEATSQRESKRVRRKGTHRWKALRIWKATALARRVWKGSSVPQRSEGESRRCKRYDRERQWPDHSACVAPTTRCTGLRLLGGRPSKGCLDGDSHSWSVRLQSRHHSKSEMPSGYPAPPWKDLPRHSYKRADERVRTEAAVAQARAELSGAAGFIGFS